LEAPNETIGQERMFDFRIRSAASRELENDSVAVRLHGKGNVGVTPCSEAVNDVIAAIRELRA
jgi:hypothetical protein